MTYLSKQQQIKRAFLLGFCSLAVTNAVLFSQDWSENEKQKILKKAKEIAKSKERDRIYVEDWQEAINHFKKLTEFVKK